MGATCPEIDERIRAFIAAQRMFFVATAPLSGSGHVNVSPKGLDSFRVLGPRRVGYLDYNGSGVETIAHVRENGRLTIMFCAFEGKPNILRLHGTGRVVETDDPEFGTLVEQGGFAMTVPVRSLIVMEVERIADSCGFGVPLYEYVGQRDQLIVSAERKGPDGLREYQRRKNAVSIDGLEGMGAGAD
jgi:hypothetical protein